MKRIVQILMAAVFAFCVSSDMAMAKGSKNNKNNKGMSKAQRKQKDIKKYTERLKKYVENQKNAEERKDKTRYDSLKKIIERYVAKLEKLGVKDPLGGKGEELADGKNKEEKGDKKDKKDDKKKKKKKKK